MFDDQKSSSTYQFLTASGTEAKVFHLSYNPDSKQLLPVQTAVTKAIPASVAQVNQQYYACASNGDIEFIDISSGMCVSSL